MANSLCKWQISKHQRKDIMRDDKRSSRFFFSDAIFFARGKFDNSGYDESLCTYIS